MRLSEHFLLLILISMVSLISPAQVPEGGTMINTQTGTTFLKIGKCTVTAVPVTDQDFSTAIRVMVGTDVVNTWDAQLKFPAVGGVAKNDVVLVAFHARTTSSPEETGEGTLNVIIEHNVSYAKQLTANVHIGGEWKEYYARTKIASPLAQSEISLLFHMGFPSQTVEVADVRFLNYHSSLNLEDLPETEITYVGQAPDATWRGPADERIHQIRKGKADIRVYDETGALLEGAQIRLEMVRHQFGFGTAVVASELISNATYRNMILENFNEVVFENDLKWPTFINKATHPAILRALDTLEAHKIPVRGHNVIWPSFRFTPAIVEDLKDHPEALRNTIDEHIDDVTSFASGRLADWDVINEPYSEHDIQDILGDEVMADWFKRVRRSDRGVKLYINEYTILSGAGINTVKQDYLYGLVEDIEKWGGEVNGIGMQGHFGTDLTSIARVYDIVDRFAQLDKEIKITEFDINTTQRVVQADYTRDFMTILFSHPSVKSILVWGFWANRHWNPEAAFYESDWTIRPHGEAWNDLIRNRWWTPVTDVVSDGGGEASFEGFLGTYSYTVTHGDVVRTGVVTLDHSFQSGLDNPVIISLDKSLPECAEITPSRPGFICSGELVTLQGPEGEGLSYRWERDSVLLEQQGRSIVVGDSGSYMVTIAKNGISMTSAPYRLELRDTPVRDMLVEGNLEFCSDESALIMVDGGGGLEFEWYRDDFRIQWGDTLLTANQTGSYRVEITDGGCTGKSYPVDLMVHASPDARVEVMGETSLCNGEGVTLQTTLIPGTIQNWYRGDELLEETGVSLVVNQPGSYTLVVTNENCSSTSIPVEIEVLIASDPRCTVGMEEEQIVARVFPNPFHGTLYVELPHASGVRSTAEVFDAIGNLVAIDQAEIGTTRMTLSINSPGIYMLRITWGDKAVFRKVINQ